MQNRPNNKEFLLFVLSGTDGTLTTRQRCDNDPTTGGNYATTPHRLIECFGSSCVVQICSYEALICYELGSIYWLLICWGFSNVCRCLQTLQKLFLWVSIFCWDHPLLLGAYFSTMVKSQCTLNSSIVIFEDKRRDVVSFKFLKSSKIIIFSDILHLNLDTLQVLENTFTFPDR